ncbi:EF-hand calcium-binding domain-containing protein 1 [Bagarius yarrelli]|uniref:EF-hand calcium-binding domain-containing protein 1 n=1 Tax=Bagarius yarrelli TaxID=175774 RepID=A0A556TPN5_BAGYA|nr:EF-hand calcium-binding domain-containing protein 1 [Bagarius yarrelli]
MEWKEYKTITQMIAVLVLLVAGLVSGNIICPDGTECQDKNTCCPTKTGYACCQYPSAVCCPDKAHCCPEDYQCDIESQLCQKKGFPWYKISFSSQLPAYEQEKKTPAPVVKSDNPIDSTVYCDNIYFCPDGTTCCKSPQGQWSCCPFTLGQCCFDGIHCCPFGYRCDSTSTQCFRDTLSFPATLQIAAMQSNNVQCDMLNPGSSGVSVIKSLWIPDNPTANEVFLNIQFSLEPLTIEFSNTETECLIRLFNTLLAEQNERKTTNGLDRSKFRNILHNTFGLTDDMILDRVFRAFDKDNDSYISVKEWVEGLSVFLRGTLDEKIKFCFDVYDLNGDGYISREEMFHMLKNCQIRQLTEEEPDEGIKDLVEIILKKMDYDYDSRLSYSDFENAVKDENLLLEAFGSCLPDTKNIQAFEQNAFQEAPKP